MLSLCLQPSIYLRLLSGSSSPQTPKAGLCPSSPLRPSPSSSPSPSPSPAGSISSPAWSPTPQPQYIHSIIPLGAPQVSRPATEKEGLGEGDSLDQISSFSSSSSSLSTPTLTERHLRQQHLEEQIEQVTSMQCANPTQNLSTSERALCSRFTFALVQPRPLPHVNEAGQRVK